MAVGYAATRRGNRLGTSRSAPGPVSERPRQGRRALLETLRLLRERPPGGNGSLHAALELADGLAAQRVAGDRRLGLSRPARLARRRCCAWPAGTRCWPSKFAIRASRSWRTWASCGWSTRSPGGSCESTRATAAARALRRGRRRGARRSRSLASAGVRHVALSTDGDWLRRCGVPPAGSGRISFSARPGCLAAGDPGCGGRVHLVRAATRRAGRTAGPARAAREHGRRPSAWRRHLPTALLLLGARAPARRVRAPAGQGSRPARGRDRRARDRRLAARWPPAIPADPSRRCAKGCRRLPRQAAEGVPRGPGHILGHTTLVTPPTHDKALARAALARAQTGPRGPRWPMPSRAPSRSRRPFPGSREPDGPRR